MTDIERGGPVKGQEPHPRWGTVDDSPAIWHGMNEYQFACLCSYVRAIADEIGLRDWTFTMLRRPVADDDNSTPLAQVTLVYGRRHASVEVCVDWNDLPPEERRHVIVHELVHCFVNPIGMLLDEQLPTLLGQPAYQAIHDSTRMHVEHAVEACARALSKHLPLPEWVIDDDAPISEPWVGPATRSE